MRAIAVEEAREGGITRDRRVRDYTLLSRQNYRVGEEDGHCPDYELSFSNEA